MINKIAVLGDSILRGVVLDEASGKYTRLAQNCVISAVKILGATADNFSRFGMTSEKGLQIAKERIVADAGYNAALICFGGNDVDHKWSDIAKNPKAQNPPNVELAQYGENMAQLVEIMRERKIEPVLLTLPPINSERYFAYFSKNIEQKDNIIDWLIDVEEIHESHRKYSQIIESVAKNLKCRIIDIRREFMLGGNYSHLLCIDGIHPNEQGHALMSRAFVDYARKYQTI